MLPLVWHTGRSVNSEVAPGVPLEVPRDQTEYIKASMATVTTCSTVPEQSTPESVKKSFSTTIRNDDFIVRDHRVHGVRVLPGVTFIDLIYRSLAGSGIDTRQMQLLNLLFKEPVVTSEDYDRVLDISIAPVGDVHRAQVVSTPVQGSRVVAEQRREVFRCDIRFTNDQSAEPLSLQHVISQATRTHDVSRIYDGARTLGIFHYEFMTSHGTVYEGRTFGLAEVYLSDLAKEYLDEFHIHPVYMDVATGMPLFMRSCAGSIAEKPYIPLHIDSFMAVRPLADPTFIYIRKAADDRFGDVITQDLELYGKDGNLCARITGLTLKEVRNDQLITSLVAKVGASAPKPVVVVKPEPPKPTAPAPAAATAGIESVIQALKSLAATAACKDPSEISEDAKFYDQGFESKELLETVTALERALGRQLYPTLLFEYGSVRELAKYLVEEQADVLDGLVKPGTTPAAPVQPAPAATSFTRQLQQIIAPLLGCEPESVAVDTSFYDLGLESSHLSGLVSELESRIGRQFYPTLLFEHSNIRELAKYLADTCGETPRRETPVENKQYSLSIYTPRWKEVQSFSSDSRCSSGPMVIFDYDGELAQDISRRRQSNAILVTPGTGFRTVGPGVFEIRPDHPSDYEQLFTAIAEAGTQPESVLHLWGLKAADSVQTAIGHGLMSIIWLSRAARAANPQGKLALTSFIDPSKAENAALAGLFRTVAQEIPALDYRLIGWDAPSPGAGHIIAAANYAHSNGGDSRYLLYRDGAYYDREIVPAAATTNTTPISIRRGGTYLITGGLGGVGLIVANHLAEKYGANLLLAGRSALGDAQRQKLEGLKRSGSRVRYVQADVSKLDELREALTAATKEFGAINGVIHAAGVIEDSLLIKKDRASIERVLTPKVDGTIAVDEATKHEPLDFFVVFSSLSGVFGNAGQADYAFANSFVDEFMAQRESLRAAGSRRGQSCSMAWPLWESGGMRPAKGYEALTRFGVAPLPSDEGLAAFEEILRLGLTTALPVYGVREQIAAHINGRTTAVTKPAARPVTAIKPAPARNDERRAANAPIAIIGLAGKYAASSTPEELWSSLREGRDLVTEIPPDRWDYRKYYDPQRGLPGKSYSKWGSFIDDVDKFDSLFFNISPVEAERMDPQERLFLETAWAAIEDSGYTPENLSRSADGEPDNNVGIFVGVMWSDYQLFGHEEFLKGNYVLASSWASMIPNRASYALNFTGPSMPVDTACSSSLVAIHMACESIRQGDCPVAIAGGVNLSLHPSKYTKTSQLQMYSSDGRCRSFGEGGDGYVPGEGVGAVLLKSLDDAIRDGDHIYGVIKGTAVKHGGRTAGFAVPSPAAQADLIASNLKKSGTDARTVSYVEAHGTGTALGDPIEIRGLTAAFRKDTNDRKFCSVGSVKSNLGHLEAAAGIAALTKVLMQMRHQEIAPTLHSTQPNSKIDFENSPFFLQHEVTPWERPRLTVDGVERVFPRTAAVSSFGAGGVNAHLVVEEFDADVEQRPSATGPSLIPLSAKSPDALKARCASLKKHLERLINDKNRPRKPGEAPAVALPDIRDVAYTLQVGRAPLEERIAIIASSCAEAVEKLGAFLEGHKSPDVFTGNTKAAAAIADVLKDGVESRDFVKQLAANRALAKLARLWTNGVPLDWSALHDGQRYRVPLPTYPFARERHWVATAPVAIVAGSIAEQLSPEPVKEEQKEFPVLLSRELCVAAGSDELDFCELIRPYPAVLAAHTNGNHRNGNSASLPNDYEAYLLGLVGEELKLRPDQIDAAESVFNYGVDSLVLMKLRSSMEEKFGELPVMLFFEYKSVRELAGYLATTQPMTNAYTDTYTHTDNWSHYVTEGAD